MDRSMDILRKYIKSIVTFSLGYGIIMILIMIPVFIVIGIAFAVSYSFDTPSYIAIGVVIALSIPVFAGISLSYNAGLIRIASQDILKESVMAHDAIKASFGSFFKVLGIAASATVLFLPVLALLGAAGYSVYTWLDGEGYLLYPFTGLAGAVGSELLVTLLVLAAILVMTFIVTVYINFFAFSLQVMTIEKAGVIKSIKRSFTLVKNGFWRILGCTVLFYLTVSALTFSLQSFLVLLSGLVYLLLEFLNVPQNALAYFALAYNITSWPISILSWLVISPILGIMNTLLYFSRRFSREGYDMELKLNEIRSNNLKLKESLPDAD